jgi:WD40 repeat protein
LYSLSFSRLSSLEHSPPVPAPMTSDDAIALIEQVLAAAGEAGLSPLQASIVRHAWCDRTYLDLAVEVGYELGYVKQVGADLWQTLSQTLGERVGKRSLKSVLSRYQQTRLETDPRGAAGLAQGLARPHVSWGEAIDVSHFYGRTAELSQLHQWIGVDRCRLVGLFGMGGMGKTTLSVKLAQQLQGEFDVVIWRCLRNGPPVIELLQDLLQVLATPEAYGPDSSPVSFDSLLRSLLDWLRRCRCLLVLDNLETLLQPGNASGTYQPGYDAYGQLLHSLGSTLHQSTVLITSREKPKEVSAQEGEALPVRSLRLTGLSPQMGRSLFNAKGRFSGDSQDWQSLVNHYAGNPLALKMVAPVIQDFFAGQLSPFIQALAQGDAVFGDIRELLASQIERLSPLERQVMVWLAIHREPVTLPQLRPYFAKVLPLGDLLATLTALERRSLIERDPRPSSSGQSTQFTLQPVVLEYLTDWFVAQVSQELQSPGQDAGLIHSHALILAQTKDYIRQTQTRLILQPILQRLLAQCSPQTLAEQLRQRLDTWRAQGRQSYASGNVLNLLQHLPISLHGWDFSGLTLWQAYLQESSLQHSSFAQADLSRAVFKDTFSQVLSVAFSPDGQLLAASDVSYEIHVWRVADAQPILTLQAQDGWCWSVTISPDNQTLASSANGTVDLWNLVTGERYGQLRGSSSRVFSLAFSPDGRFLACGGEDHLIRVWSVQRRTLMHCLVGHGDEVRSVAFAPQGYLQPGQPLTSSLAHHQLASGSYDGTVRLWNLGTGDWVAIATQSKVWSIAFSPDGSTLASGQHDGTVGLWDVATQTAIRTLRGHTAPVRSVAFRPDSCCLASGSQDKSIRLWNWQTGQVDWVLQGHKSWVSNVAFSPDGSTLASSSEDQSVRLWDSQQKQTLRVLRGYNSGVWSVALTPDGTHLVSGGQDRQVRLWPLTEPGVQQELGGHQGWVLAVAVSPDNRWIASGGEDGTVRLWNRQTGTLVATWTDHSHEVWSVEFVPQSPLLISSSLDGSIRLWSTETQTGVGVLQGHDSGIWALAVSPDGRRLASGSQDQTVRIWDIDSQTCVQTLACKGMWVRGVAFSPDGRFLASTGSNGYVMLWDLKLGQCTVVGTHDSLVLSTAFSPDGEWLATCSGDASIKLWHLRTRRCHQTLTGHRKWVRYLCFSSDGQRLISCSQDETIRVWQRCSTETGGIYRCDRILRMPRPYEGMDITRVTGLTAAQKGALITLGAQEKSDHLAKPRHVMT